MKYDEAGLLKTSAGRGWVGITAELRNHAAGLIVEQKTGVDTELAIAVTGSNATITRTSGKHIDTCGSALGTIWVCPAGIKEDSIEASDFTMHVLHIYLSSKTFEDLTDDSLHGVDAVEYVTYGDGSLDPLLAQCGHAIVQELSQESSGGRILIGAIANTIAARLVHSNTGLAPDGAVFAARSGLERRRLLRVLEAIDADLEGDLSLAHLASVACLSQFHFARAFKTTMGLSPHQYVSSRRLERAKDLIMAGDLPLVEVAANLGFSSQANFNRAFKTATGLSPMAYKLAMAD